VIIDTKNVSEEFNMITFKEIKYFIAVSEELNFRKAAKKLNISQPPLSQQIMILENKIGFKLLNRNKSFVGLTKAGSRFLEDCYDITLKINRSINNAKKIDSGETGILRIGFSTLSSFGILPDIVSKFHSRFKDTEIQLKEMRSEKIVKEILNKRIDVGFAGKKIINTNIKSKLIHRQNILLAVCKDNKLSKKKKINIEDLKNEKFILFPKSNGALGLYDKVIEYCKDAGFEPNVVQEVFELEVMLGLVSNGMGVAIVPESSQVLFLKNIIYKKFNENILTSDIEILIRNKLMFLSIIFITSQQTK
jgi:DNA-binding transcriptional LysR family regulator